METSQDVVELARILQHISTVQALLRKVANRLLERADLHDLSKLTKDELGGMIRISQNKFSSPEYVDALASPVVKCHWSRNSHHPEHFASGFKDMGVLDVIEMVCDWKVANILHGHLGWEESMDIMAERLHLSIQEYYFVKAISQLVKDVGE